MNPSSEPSEGKSPVLKEKPISADAAASAMASAAANSERGSSEKRRAERTRTDQLLYVELGTGNGGILLDVSEQGCGFLSIAPIWDDAPHFSFAIGGGRHIEGSGKVVWLDQSKKLGGLRFVDESPALREQVRAWLAEPKVEAPPPEPKPLGEPQADILKPIEDSPAKQRRRQLREEARAKMEEAERAMRAAESGEVAEAAEKRGSNDIEHVQGNREQIFLHGPSQRDWPAFLSNSKVWKGVAGFAVGATVAALAFVYHQEAGSALMRLGTSLAGKQEQVAVAESSAAAGATRPVESKPVSTGAKSLVQDAVERKAGPMDSAKRQEPAKVQEAAASESKTPPQNAARTSSTNAGSNPSPVVRKLNTAAQPEEPTLKKQELGSVTQPAASAEHPQTTAGVTKLTPAAPTIAPKKREAHHATAEQVQALWSEVEGGDVAAAVALGELYARGNGVPKSCGQARMLLNSAAKKGSDAAQQKLEQLGDEGCP